MKSKKLKSIEPEDGILTENMIKKGIEYEDFKLLIKSKVANQSKEQNVQIRLLGLKFKIEDYLKSKNKDKPIGGFIREFLEALEVKQIEFAKFINIRPSNFSKILNGERRLSLDLALILENLSNISAEYWLMIQNRNEVYKMKKVRKKDLVKYKLNELIK